MMGNGMNEQIQVGAVFGKGKRLLRPVWFVWKNRRHVIREITYTWKTDEGRSILYHFSVTDGVNLYNIAFHPDRMIWKLCAVDMEG